MSQESLEISIEGKKIYENPKELIHEIFGDLMRFEKIHNNLG